MAYYLVALALCLFSVCRAEPALIDGRPYEFVWANRTADDRPVLLPLTDCAGWTVETTNAAATFSKTTKHRLFGDGVARLTYRGAGKSPRITLRPPAPVPVRGGVDTVSVWVWGNRVNYARDASTPPVSISAMFTDAAGRPFSVRLYNVAHLEWFLVQRRLTGEQIKRLAGGGHFTGFKIEGGTNDKDRAIELTSLAVYREELKPLVFKARAKRPNRVFPEAPAGVHVGEGELPFPNRANGVVPYRAEPQVEYRLPSSSVNWDDLAVKGPDGKWRRFAVGGGVWSATTNGAERVARDDVKVDWHVEGQSLVADVRGPAGIADVRFGALADFPEAEMFIVPYWTQSMTGCDKRPHVACVDFGGRPFFCSATPDWTQSNGSEPWCDPKTSEGFARPYGGVRYNVKTDGARNPVFERFVWSFAPEFADVLPVIPNPPSPYRSLTADYEWCHMSAQKNRQSDKNYWRDRKRRRLDKVFIGDHEVCMRDGNESFTFRTRTAPGKGGDEGTLDFTRYMIDELGYLYGPYNNYTDFATVNEYWHADNMTRDSSGNLVRAWNRCYSPKPVWAVEMCERIVPALQGKFKFNSGYCDVHTCVTPWERCDYDARVPGGGTFAATFYAYGELLMLQRKFWEGPVYSEGGVHFMYCGLDDGNFAQDQGARLDKGPWLVDFDLLRMHPLANNFGMGYPRMFYRDKDFKKNVPEWAERFYAATLAFGHVGYFMTGSPDHEEQGYHLVQPVASRYAKSDVREIMYADEKGAFVPTSAALASGAYKRSQVRVTYADGTRVTVNGSAGGERLVLPWKDGVLPLPANGWLATTGDGKVCSVGGGRADACVSDAAVYLDGRGKWFDTPFGATDGRLIRVFDADGTEEVFIRRAKEVELPYEAGDVRMLDKEGKDVGRAAFVRAAGRTRLTADPRAYSYRAKKPASHAEPAAATLADAFVCEAAPTMSLRLRGPHTATEEQWSKTYKAVSENPGCCDEVWLSTGIGVPPLAWHREQVKRLAKASEDLRKIGIVPSLQFQATLGHSDGLSASEDCSAKKWGGWTGSTGVEDVYCNCPRQPGFLAYLREMSRLYATLKPGSVWVDDDLRIGNHMPATKNSRPGCWCETCIGAFNKETQGAWTRESLLSAIKKDGKLEKDWMAFSIRSISDIARLIAEEIHAVSPKTMMGFQHAFNADAIPSVSAVVKAFTQTTGRPVGLRPGGGMYYDVNPADQIMKSILAVRFRKMAKLDDVAVWCPEVESWPRAYGSRSAQSALVESFAAIGYGCNSTSLLLLDTRYETDELYSRMILKPLADASPVLSGFVRANEGARPVGFSADKINVREFYKFALTGIPLLPGAGLSLGDLTEKDLAADICTLGSQSVQRLRDQLDARANGSPAVVESPFVGLLMPNAMPDGTLRTVGLLNTRIDAQGPVTLRLRNVPAGAKLTWRELRRPDVKLPAVRDGGLVRVTIPEIGAWNAGYVDVAK